MSPYEQIFRSLCTKGKCLNNTWTGSKYCYYHTSVNTDKKFFKIKEIKNAK